MDEMTLSAISMKNDLDKLNQISNNIANMTTPGYKRTVASMASFSDQLVGLQAAGKTTHLHKPLPTVQTTTDLSQGGLKFTGNPLNVAIEGDGFFELSGPGGTFYSKRGDFTLDASGRLKLANTDMVLNGVSGSIRLSSEAPEINNIGHIMENGKNIDQIKVVNFDHPERLSNVGQGLFQIQSQISAQEVNIPAIRQGHIEASNIQPAEEMLGLMQVARHLEATQQVIRGYDDMLGTVFEDLGNV